MTLTERRYGAQSMTRRPARRPRQAARAGVRARLRRPGPRLPPSGRPRAARSASTTRFVETPRSASGRRSTSSTTRPTIPDLVYTFDPLLVTDRGAIPLRPGKPNRAGEPAILEAWTRGRGHPDGRPDRGARDDRGRRHVLAPAGPALHRADAADERRRRAPAGGDRRRRRPDLRRAVLARPGRARPPPVGHLAGRRRPRGRLPAAPAGRAVGAARRARDPARRGPGGGVPDARLQRPGRPARGRDRRRGQSRDAARRSRPPAARSTRSRSARSARTARAGRPA